MNGGWCHHHWLKVRSHWECTLCGYSTEKNRKRGHIHGEKNYKSYGRNNNDGSWDNGIKVLEEGEKE
jgi:hypothetical protein